MNSIKKIDTNLAVDLRVAGAALLLGLFALVPVAAAHEANLTRFGPKIYEPAQGAPAPPSRPATFRALAGTAIRVLQSGKSVSG